MRDFSDANPKRRPLFLLLVATIGLVIGVGGPIVAVTVGSATTATAFSDGRPPPPSYSQEKLDAMNNPVETPRGTIPGLIKPDIPAGEHGDPREIAAVQASVPALLAQTRCLSAVQYDRFSVDEEARRSELARMRETLPERLRAIYVPGKGYERQLEAQTTFLNMKELGEGHSTFKRCKFEPTEWFGMRVEGNSARVMVGGAVQVGDPWLYDGTRGFVMVDEVWSAPLGPDDPVMLVDLQRDGEAWKLVDYERWSLSELRKMVDEWDATVANPPEYEELTQND